MFSSHFGRRFCNCTSSRKWISPNIGWFSESYYLLHIRFPASLFTNDFFVLEKFRAHVKEYVVKWKIFYLSWLKSFPEPIHLIIYEVLKNDTKEELTHLSRFIGLNYTQRDMACTLMNQTGTFLRNGKSTTRESVYDRHLKWLVGTAIDEVLYEIHKKGGRYSTFQYPSIDTNRSFLYPKMSMSFRSYQDLRNWDHNGETANKNHTSAILCFFSNYLVQSFKRVSQGKCYRPQKSNMFNPCSHLMQLASETTVM